MKIKILIPLILSGLLISIFLIPVTEKSTISIAAPELAISQQLNSAENWGKWNVSLKKDLHQDSGKYQVINEYSLHTFSISTPQQSLLVKSPAGNSFDITNKKNNGTFHYNVLLNFDKKSNSTSLFIEEKIPLFTSIFSSSKKKNPDTSVFSYLKKYMETDSLYYGFSIGIRNVVDTNIVFLTRHITLKEKFVAPPAIFKELLEFTTANHLAVTQPFILQYNQLPPDSLNIIAMLAVNKILPKKSSVNFMTMPIKGRMLVGYFKGKFKDRIQLQIAIQRYILDKNIYSILGSYEKYLNNKLPENDDSIVKIEMYFPIL